MQLLGLILNVNLEMSRVSWADSAVSVFSVDPVFSVDSVDPVFSVDSVDPVFSVER